MSTPKVSVLVLTYNHEQFIGQALDSILSQQVDFDYEVIVGEDCSTDQTRAIVQDYERRYPDRLRPLYHPRNVGPGANAKACWAACTGQYIALLDGDDYWTNPLKLTRQVACLDANPEASLCFHQVEVQRGQHLEPDLLPLSTTQRLYHFPDFIRTLNTCAHTGSLLLRRGCRPLPDWLFTTYPIDYPLLVLYVEVGPAHLLPEVMGRYRLHAGSTWSSASYGHNLARFLAMYRLLVAHYAATRYARPLRQTLCQFYLSAADDYLLRRGLPQEAVQMLRQAARMPQAYRMPRVRLLAGLTVRWLWRRYQAGPADAAIPAPSHRPD